MNLLDLIKPGALAKLISDAAARVGRVALIEAKSKAPVDAGRLRNSLEFAANRWGLVLRSRLDYAGFVNDRTPFIPREDEVVRALELELERAWA